MLDAQNFSDLSNDENNAGAAAMTVDSENKEEVEMDPYWTKIKVDELQGIAPWRFCFLIQNLHLT